VWQLVAEPATYPSWWRQYPSVRRLNALQGVGALWQMQIQFQANLPYRLRFTLELVRSEKRQEIEWRAQGDLTGQVGFTLEETLAGTRVTYRSDLRTRKLTLNTISPLVKPLFDWNHKLMMRSAEADLRTELARRSVYPRRVRSNPGRPRILPPGEGTSVQVLASSITFKAVTEDTAGAFSFLAVLTPRLGAPPAHLFYRLDGVAYVAEGTFLFLVGDRVLEVSAGSLLSLPRNTWHDWKNVGKGPGRVLLIGTPSGFEHFFLEVSRLGAGSLDFAKIQTIGHKYGTEIRLPPSVGWWTAAPGQNVTPPIEAPLLPPGGGQSFRALGNQITFKVTGEQSHGVYTLFETNDPPGGGQPLHLFHAIDGAAYVLEGNYSFQIGDQHFPAPPGSFVFLPRGVWHRWTNVGATPGRVLEIASPAGFEKAIAEVAQLPPGPPDVERLRAISQKYGAEIRLEPPGG
jgi:quercetin dioxygenase-like cupin family protein